MNIYILDFFFKYKNFLFTIDMPDCHLIGIFCIILEEEVPTEAEEERRKMEERQARAQAIMGKFEQNQNYYYAPL